jgi:hypothetical protein
VRGAGVNAGTSGASVGSHENPPVLGIELTGGGGNRVVVPARNEAYGAACGGSPSAFYQAFLNGQAFDLRGLALTPNDPATPTYYTVSGAAEPVDPTFTDYFPESTADDGVVAHPLGFTFYFPGGSTNAIVASTNGFVWLASGVAVSDFSPTLAELLGSSAPRLAPFWCDLNCGRNVTTHPLAGLHVQTDTTGGPGNAVCYVTWRDVGVYDSAAVAGTAVHTFQLVLRQATGAVEFRYGSMPRHAASSLATNPSYPVLVGFSRGQIGANPSADPRSRDLSLEVPFTTFPEGGVANLGLSSIGTDSGGLAYGARAFAGQALYWTADNVPPTAVLGVCLLDIVAARPGFSLPTITAPGCILSTSANAVLWELHVTPGASATTSHPFVVPPGFDGVDLHAQYVVLGGLFGAPDLITVASNALRHTVGRR